MRHRSDLISRQSALDASAACQSITGTGPVGAVQTNRIMYIKRIIIEGFKTYKDRVVIEFDAGMTIIGTSAFVFGWVTV
jgi:hypothetical protein